jgi:DNA-binding XRE family transcriptional regulator
VAPARLHLTDPELLRRLMTWAPGGKPITVAELAATVGVSRTKIYALLDGTRPTMQPAEAHRIAQAVGVHQGALFLPLASTSVDIDNRPTPHHEGTP